LSRVPDPLVKYPLFVVSHALSEIVRAFPAVVAAGVVGFIRDREITEVAPNEKKRSLHVVLKWLHHLEEDQNVTLLHWADFWHDWEHAARLSRVPDPLVKYPLFVVSHAWFESVTVLPAVLPAGVVRWLPDWNVTEVAPLSVTKLSHIVLKWLHHLEEDQNVTLLHWADFWHDWEHAERLSSTPDKLARYPLFVVSHALPTKVVDSGTGLGGCDKVLVIMAMARINAKNRDDGCADHGRKEAEDGIETILLQRTIVTGTLPIGRVQ
jgi:hypothetical protein